MPSRSLWRRSDVTLWRWHYTVKAVQIVKILALAVLHTAFFHDFAWKCSFKWNSYWLNYAAEARRSANCNSPCICTVTKTQTRTYWAAPALWELQMLQNTHHYFNVKFTKKLWDNVPDSSGNWQRLRHLNTQSYYDTAPLFRPTPLTMLSLNKHKINREAAKYLCSKRHNALTKTI